MWVYRHGNTLWAFAITDVFSWLQSFMCTVPLNVLCAVKQTEQNNRRQLERGRRFLFMAENSGRARGRRSKRPNTGFSRKDEAREEEEEGRQRQEVTPP